MLSHVIGHSGIDLSRPHPSQTVILQVKHPEKERERLCWKSRRKQQVQSLIVCVLYQIQSSIIASNRLFTISWLWNSCFSNCYCDCLKQTRDTAGLVEAVEIAIILSLFVITCKHQTAARHCTIFEWPTTCKSIQDRFWLQQRTLEPSTIFRLPSCSTWVWTSGIRITPRDVFLKTTWVGRPESPVS